MERSDYEAMIAPLNGLLSNPSIQDDDLDYDYDHLQETRMFPFCIL